MWIALKFEYPHIDLFKIVVAEAFFTYIHLI